MKVVTWQCPLCGDTFEMRPNTGRTFQTQPCRTDWHCIDQAKMDAHDFKHRFEFWLWNILGSPQVQ